MRSLLTLIMIALAGFCFGMNVEQCSTNGNSVQVRLENVRSLPDYNADPAAYITSLTYALPYSEAILSVNSIMCKEFDSDGNFIRTSSMGDEGIVKIANSFTFREMRGFTVNIQNQIHKDNVTKVVDKIDFSLLGVNPIELPTSISPAFQNAYQELAANYDSSYLRNLPLARPKLLIISHTSLTSYLTPFVNWKKSKGFDVYVANIQTIGSTTTALKDFLVTHYNQYKCDYLLLLGDVTGTYTIPTNIYTSPDGTEHDADDNYFSMLVGEDYFPEMIPGRFSFGDISEYLTMSNKTVYYEKTPYLSNTNWMTRSLVVAGNYAEGGLRPVTPYQMSMWLREKMLSDGYTQVDTVFYTLENPTITGASAILASLNQGVQLVSYRGWGAADGWHYPSFHNQDLNNINNGGRMPAVFSIVCNTGDFANALNPCFGEKWLRLGSPTVPKGGVAFVGPSDLHTKTNLNNTISSGMFSSILDNGEFNFGAAVLAGKIELYKTYPLDLGSNGYVSFYYHVYNILSDPSLNLWNLIPETIPTTVIPGGTTFSQSDSHILIQASNLNGAYVSGTKNGTDFTYATVHDGYALLPIDPEQTGNLTVTVIKNNFIPRIVTMTPTAAPSIGVIDNSIISETLTPGQTYQMVLTLKNYTDNSLSDIAASLEATPAGRVNITNPNQNISSLGSSQTTTLTFLFTVAGDVPSSSFVRFNLTFSGYPTVSSFDLVTGGPRFTVLSSTGSLAIGGNNPVSFTIMNTGTSTFQSGNVTILSSTNAAIVSPGTVSLNNVEVNSSTIISTSIQVQSGCFPGRNIPLVFVITTPAGYETICYYSMTAGNPSTSDPTGPDKYGYFAYDNTDLSYPAHPTYQWVEIDTTNPAVEVHNIMDDGSYTVNLPFTFRYYGQDYTQMTICSNGWVSMVTTWMNDFNNLYIPAPLGPYGMIAPYWDDLKGLKTNEDSLGSYFNDMHIINWYDQVNNRYIVEWRDAYSQFTIDLMENASLERFQLILYPIAGNDGDIVFQYHTISNPSITSNYCTIGIENHLQNDGLTYSYANLFPATAAPLQNGLAVKFTRTAPDTFVANEDESVLQAPFVLNQNSPNPFNPKTAITFSVNTKDKVRLDIFNLKGQKIRTLLNDSIGKGNHSVEWNGTDDSNQKVSSGIYIYKMSSGNLTLSRKMLMMQ